MKFNYQENMCVNVKEAIEKSTKNDYVDFGDALGVIVHKSSYFEAIIVYDEIHDIVSVEIVKKWYWLSEDSRKRPGNDRWRKRFNRERIEHPHKLKEIIVVFMLTPLEKYVIFKITKYRKG